MAVILLSIFKTCQKYYCFLACYEGTNKNSEHIVWLAHLHPPIFALPKIARWQMALRARETGRRMVLLFI